MHNLAQIIVCACGTNDALLLRELSPSKCFSAELFGLALIQVRIRRLITQPGDQWAYPGIVLLSVFDGVSLRVLELWTDILDITW